MKNDDIYPDTGSSLRGKTRVWVNSPVVGNTIIALIILNAITIGLETSSTMMAHFGGVLIAIDHIILGVFVAEIGAKMFAEGWRFFRRPWNIFDFLVVGIALVPSSGPLAVLRTLRILRVLRLISALPRLRFVVEALLHALPGIGGDRHADDGDLLRRRGHDHRFFQRHPGPSGSAPSAAPCTPCSKS
jgi:voltage-gated sodium channel